jgi:hypothetical protein
VPISVRQATPDDLDAIVMLLGELHVRSTAVADADAGRDGGSVDGGALGYERCAVGFRKILESSS